MIKEITDWLCSARDYRAGVELYEKYGQSWNLKRILSRQEPCESSMQTLVYELTQLEGNNEQIPPAPPRRRPAPGIPVDPLPVAPVAMPRIAPQVLATSPSDDFVALLQEIKTQWKTLDALHATLEHVTPAQRCIDAHMILDIADALDVNYQRKHHYEKYGVLPDGPKPAKAEKVVQPVEKMDPMALIRARDNERSHISRIKGYLHNPAKKSKIDHYSNELAKHESRLKEIERQIG